MCASRNSTASPGPRRPSFESFVSELKEFLERSLGTPLDGFEELFRENRYWIGRLGASSYMDFGSMIAIEFHEAVDRGDDLKEKMRSIFQRVQKRLYREGKRVRGREVPGNLDVFAGPGPDPETTIDFNKAQQLVGELSPEDALIFTMYLALEAERGSFTTIAKDLRMKPGTVRKRIRRIQARLRERLTT